MIRTVLRPTSRPHFGRSAAVPLGKTFCLSAARWTPSALSKAVIADHAQLGEYYESYKRNTHDPAEAQKWANAFLWELARHAIAEELVVFPAWEKHLGEAGTSMANHDRAETQKLKEDAFVLQQMDASSPHFRDVFALLFKKLDIHVKEEEKEDYPKFEAILTEQESEEYAQRFNETKRWAPTRSHPMAPNEPPYLTAASALAAPIDKVRDLFRSWPNTSGDPKNANHE